MTRNSISYPKVCNDKLGNYYVDFRLQQKRFRLFNGNKIGSSLSPNSYPAKMRRAITTELAREDMGAYIADIKGETGVLRAKQILSE